jgi:hypothetical protein
VLRIAWGVLLTDTVGNLLRKSGKLRPAEDAETTIAGRRHRESNQRLAERNANMSFDIVGDDDDYDAIGYEDLIGEEDFLDALVEGDLDDLISGAGDMEIVGATAAQRKRAKAAKAKAAMRKIAMRNAGAVMKRGLDRRRRYPLGFVPTTITAGSTSLIPSTPQNLFRPERLVIPSDIAFDAGVADLKVGNQSQFVETAEVPGALFSEVSINTGVTFDTAEVGNQVSISCRNKSLSDFQFTAGLVGTIAK